MTASVEFIVQARRRGVRLVVSGDRLRYRGSVEAIALLTEAPETAREVLRRAEILQEQLDEWARSGHAVAPLLVLPGAAPCAGACASCGIPVGPAGWRCSLCQHAVELVLGLEPGLEAMR
jgi:hypothetical protein